MDVKVLEHLITILKEQGIQEIEVQQGDTKYRVVQAQVPTALSPYPYAAFPPSAPMGMQGMPVTATSPAVPASTPAPAASTYHAIRSPFVGTFYDAPSPGSDPFVQVGQRVKKGDTLCIVEAMKLMNEIEADRDGILTAVLIQNEEPVEYDQELFRIE